MHTVAARPARSVASRVGVPLYWREEQSARCTERERELDEPQRKELIVRAIDLVIADVEERDDSQRDDDLRILRELRQQLLDGD
jgi:hypothetical protein